MTTICHTNTLFDYDGPQLFEAHDDDGGQYLALLVDSEEEQDRYLVVQVDPERLQQFRSGALELRPLIAEASRNQWYLATATNLDGPLAIERQRMPIFEQLDTALELTSTGEMDAQSALQAADAEMERFLRQ